ncbi:MAG: hypothetical protein NVSMB62_14220 [Acidobacteriaceae bacterium]
MIRPVILICFVYAQLSGFAAKAASRPTHSPVRDARRLVVPAPSRDAAHGRAGHQSQMHGHSSSDLRAGSSRHRPGASARHGGTHSALGVASARRGKAVRGKVAKTGRGTMRLVRGSRGAAGSNAGDREVMDRVHSWEKTQHPLPELKAAPSMESRNEATETVVPGTDSIFAANLTPPSAAELPRVKSMEDEAATPVLLPSLYDKRGRLAVPAPLRGSHEVLVHQNEMADHDGLSRVRDDDDLMDLRRQGKLVALPAGWALKVDDRLPANRRYSRPWTAEFLAVISRDFFRAFHEPLQVNSAVRTVEIQQRLVRTNGNAAPVAGETASPHLTGQAVDIGKRGLTMLQIAWMRAYLGPLIDTGKIDVEEEFQQSCFHISVYKSYEPPLARLTVAAARPVHRAGTN